MIIREKAGVVLAEIHLPKQAPERFKDRETLWNEVEWIEGNKKAQLAHSFDIALMNEFSMEENIELARRFVEEQLVARGMIADLAIHDPKRQRIKYPSPYAHHGSHPPFTGRWYLGTKTKKGSSINTVDSRF